MSAKNETKTEKAVKKNNPTINVSIAAFNDLTFSPTIKSFLIRLNIIFPPLHSETLYPLRLVCLYSHYLTLFHL